jgi:hypothetical protein
MWSRVVWSIWIVVNFTWGQLKTIWSQFEAICDPGQQYELEVTCSFLWKCPKNIFGHFLTWWAYAITWHPSLSASRARFVTTGAIDPKLCTYVPLGKSNSQTKFRSSRILVLATSWTNGCIQICIIGISNKDTWHNTQVFDLNCLWRSQSSK